MEKEEYTLEELEAIIAEYRNKVAFARAHPAYESMPPMKAAVAEIENVIADLEAQAASMQSTRLLHEIAEDTATEAASDGYDGVRRNMIAALLEGQPNQEEWIKMAYEIRAIERIHNTYKESDWADVAHLLPPLSE